MVEAGCKADCRSAERSGRPQRPFPAAGKFEDFAEPYPDLREFIVAKNPEADSTLPFLIFVPLADGGLWLKAKASWPRTARVYCHPVDVPSIEALEIIERVPVATSVRRGAAIDLILERGINKRSQFIFTVFRGRSMIFWQTPKTATATRPGVRVPFGRAQAMEAIVIDTRERYGYTFRGRDVTTLRKALSAGDYAALNGDTIVAIVERKSIDDFIASVSSGDLNFAMAELATLPHAAVVVEGSYSAILRHPYASPGYLADVVARLFVRYPSVQIVFVESRKLGEEWTFRFLKAATSLDAANPELALSAAPPTAAPAAARKRRSKKSQ